MVADDFAVWGKAVGWTRVMVLPESSRADTEWTLSSTMTWGIFGVATAWRAQPASQVLEAQDSGVSSGSVSMGSLTGPLAGRLSIFLLRFALLSQYYFHLMWTAFYEGFLSLCMSLFPACCSLLFLFWYLFLRKSHHFLLAGFLWLVVTWQNTCWRKYFIISCVPVFQLFTLFSSGSFLLLFIFASPLAGAQVLHQEGPSVSFSEDSPWVILISSSRFNIFNIVILIWH